MRDTLSVETDALVLVASLHGKTEWMMHRVVCVALLDGSRVLLGHRSSSREWLPNVWDFPGGHVEVGELPDAALVREAREELDVEIVLDEEPAVLHLAGPELDFTVWATRTWRGDVRNAQPEEHDELGWFTLEECRGLRLADERYLPMLRQLLREEPWG